MPKGVLIDTLLDEDIADIVIKHEGEHQIVNLLNFWEEKKVLMIAIRTTSILFDKRFEDKLTLLSKNDQDLSIRNAAIKALENNYSNMEPITDE